MNDIAKGGDSLLTLFADSGSTKTDWCLVYGGTPVFRCNTQGINPAHQQEAQIRDVVQRELLPQLRASAGDLWQENRGRTKIRFYGAGCRGASADALRVIITGCLSVAGDDVLVDSDMMAAAHALCHGEEGIACILGTGANSCLFDGERIVRNISPLGYILGDEGSGAVLGKIFVNAVFKGGLPELVCRDFLDETHLDVDTVIRRVYREPLANRFLASLSPFIHRHIDVPEVEKLVVDNFISFFRRNVDMYGRKDLPVSAVGSVAYYYHEQLEAAAGQCGYEIGKVMKSPIEGLVASV